jgi:cytochrome b pre-mRNA-processing protein 3
MSAMLKRFFQPRPARIAGEALYAAAAAQARTPGFYRELGVEDTREGRFELYTLHVILLMDRLRGQGPAADETSQALSERYVRGLDDAFRELGIGDVGLAKRMKALGQAFYGRLKAYSEAFATLPDQAALRDVVARTALEGREAEADALTAYVIRSREALSAQPLERLCDGVVVWETLA